MNPAVINAVIRANIKRRPLWKVKTIEDFFDLPRARVMAKIESGEFPWAFNIGQGKHTKEPRILAYSVLEAQIGPFEGIGATKNLQLPELINLILPARDVRSTELGRLFSCGHDQIRKLTPNFIITKKPAAQDGPLSFTVFSRASVAKFLAQRRML